MDVTLHLVWGSPCLMSGRVMKTFVMESYTVLLIVYVDADVSLQRVLACREEKDDGALACS